MDLFIPKARVQYTHCTDFPVDSAIHGGGNCELACVPAQPEELPMNVTLLPSAATIKQIAGNVPKYDLCCNSFYLHKCVLNYSLGK